MNARRIAIVDELLIGRLQFLSELSSLRLLSLPQQTNTITIAAAVTVAVDTAAACQAAAVAAFLITNQLYFRRAYRLSSSIAKQSQF